MTRTLKPLILNTGALALTLILIYTGISAHDKLTWLLEEFRFTLVSALSIQRNVSAWQKWQWQMAQQAFPFYSQCF